MEELRQATEEFVNLLSEISAKYGIEEEDIQSMNSGLEKVWNSVTMSEDSEELPEVIEENEEVEVPEEVEEEYAHNFLQYVNMVTKPFYQNCIGSPMFKNTTFDSVKRLFTCLWHNFEKQKPAYDLIEPIYNHYQHDKPKEGYIYIINNIRTIKVGFSDDPERRYYQLKRDNQIYHSAQLEYKLKTDNMVLAEALCHAKLCQYKTSNPLITSRSNRCDKGWDEHFNITVDEAYENIKEIVEKI